MDALERLRQSPLPFAALLGIQFTAAAPERVTAELIVRDDLCTRPAILHGGAIMAFADTLGAAATILNLAEGAGTTTIESENEFHRPCAGRQQDTRRGNAGSSRTTHHGLANQDHERGGALGCPGDANAVGARASRFIIPSCVSSKA
jgi:uncharacterized protein (TIGR00369 family)